ncbi:MULTISPECIES: DUF397 domain-containing protein [Streptomyces]|uniref:DUF397 domain-containing protein n=1 Tax=Streptomyces rutgersensis TaxID=53451 RepID=A0ABX6RRU3_9ACTN|nr:MULTISPECIES: DUF397 domain-containing protein [Streptomyces]NEE42122.1 DUF397 domain-containing protein [Streptomyces sp. SID7982]QNE83225.1 DUF397 domain-containing protein [Streptomyces rutgersensis]WPR53273.1 DUF397 domain-containing protein [Streptomyces sp. S399]WSU35666.1 DUF397 domain-containing protein [Streptomyces gougerotii]
MIRTDERTWAESSYSGSGGDVCVEVAREVTAVGVRDSKGVRSPEPAFPHGVGALRGPRAHGLGVRVPDESG